MRLIIIIFFIFTARIIYSQSRPKLDISAYYSTKFATESTNSLGQTYNIWDHNLNISLRYLITKRWITGAEYMLSHIDGEKSNNPFYLAGIFVDYDIFKDKIINYYIKMGLNRSNQLFLNGKDEPIKRKITNLSVGFTADIKLYKVFYFWGGLNYHYPLNKIQLKEGNFMPIVGLRVMIF